MIIAALISTAAVPLLSRSSIFNRHRVLRGSCQEVETAFLSCCVSFRCCRTDVASFQLYEGKCSDLSIVEISPFYLLQRRLMYCYITASSNFSYEIVNDPSLLCSMYEWRNETAEPSRFLGLCQNGPHFATYFPPFCCSPKEP